jgi:hypothetical protein
MEAHLLIGNFMNYCKPMVALVSGLQYLLVKKMIVTKKGFLSGGALALSVFALPSFATEADEPVDFVLGAMTHFGVLFRGEVKENLNMFKAAGLESPRDSVGWESWERKKNIYKVPRMFGPYLDYSKELKLKPLVLINHGNDLYQKGYPKSPEAIAAYARFAEWVVLSMKGKCTMFQVWNEWGGGCAMPVWCRGLGDAESYVKLLAAAYPLMKKANPEALVMSNSICMGEVFLEKCLKAGMLKHCDGVAIHAYNYDNSAKSKRTPEAWLERLKGMEEQIKRHNNGKEFPIYATEIGYPTHTAKGGSTDKESADSIARIYLLARTTSFIKGVWWYDFQDDGNKASYSEHNFGLVKSDLTPKEAFYSIRSISHIIRHGGFIKRLESKDKNLYALLFKMPDNSDALALWSLYGEDKNIHLTLTRDGSISSKVDCYPAGFAAISRNWGFRDWVPSRSNKIAPELFRATLGGRPYIIEGDLSGIRIVKTELLDFPVSKRRRSKMQVVEKPTLFYATPAEHPEKIRKLNFGKAQNYRARGSHIYGGKKDIDASFSLRWAPDALVLDVEVGDNKHVQNNPPEKMWKGDSIQVAFHSLVPNAPGGWNEYTIALGRNGATTFCECSQSGKAKGRKHGVKTDVQKQGNKLLYKLRFPVNELALGRLEEGMMFGFSILVNDNDQNGCKGYLHWGDGVGNGKNPNEFNRIELEK